ncbi:MAG: tetratricopeptide repeat protein [Bacteroidota bacterium]
MEIPIRNQQEDFELIERFLEFELSAEELAAFEKRMDDDAVLQRRFQLYQEMSKTVEQASGSSENATLQTDLKNAIFKKAESTTATTASKEAKIRRMPMGRVLALAASVIILLGIGWWLMMDSGNFDTAPELAAHFWQQTDRTHLVDGTVRSDNPEDPNEVARLFFQSIERLQSAGDYPAMVAELQRYTSATPPILFEDDAEWMLALAYLGTNDLENARAKLKEIVTKYPARKRRVESLLSEIEEL